MAHRALTQILLGLDPPLAPGDPVPATYTNSAGEQQPVDLECLLEAGAIERDEPKPKAASKAKAPAGDPEE